MKKILAGCLVGVMALGCIPHSLASSDSIAKEAKITPKARSVNSSFKNEILASRGSSLESLRESRQEEEIKYYNVPISKSLQRHIWRLSKQYDIQYELILAVIATESDFHIHEDNGIAAGLMQINYCDSTLEHLGRQVGLGSNPNAYDPYDNTSMGVAYLRYLKDYWVKRGHREHADSWMLISYNRGIGGALSYIRDNGLESNYTTKVYENLDKIQGGTYKQ